MRGCREGRKRREGEESEDTCKGRMDEEEEEERRGGEERRGIRICKVKEG